MHGRRASIVCAQPSMHCRAWAAEVGTDPKTAGTGREETRQPLSGQPETTPFGVEFVLTRVTKHI